MMTKAQVLMAAKALGMGMCLIAAPVAYKAGSHKPVHHSHHIAKRSVAPLKMAVRACPDVYKHPVTFSEARLMDNHLGDVPYEDTITIDKPTNSVPEPWSLVLWASGLSLIGAAWSLKRWG